MPPIVNHLVVFIQANGSSRSIGWKMTGMPTLIIFQYPRKSSSLVPGNQTSSAAHAGLSRYRLGLRRLTYERRPRRAGRYREKDYFRVQSAEGIVIPSAFTEGPTAI
ncbi:hypothetical protein [Bradyrhizobium sp. 1(2017)]|uniref:hypothetical protein n=1 Tax=Bradyrhizobium sp. 1(2017) TaxID=1404888 RepID=UPI00140EE47A|nr:hypothetical protein [Bradyrhizobium sp. 1(2017)]QIO32323.1 hypothetical protein HAP40_11005 [Bradyrhizobium sp. 1(2017)]